MKISVVGTNLGYGVLLNGEIVSQSRDINMLLRRIESRSISGLPEESTISIEMPKRAYERMDQKYRDLIVPT
jgi:hypothetical protein